MSHPRLLRLPVVLALALSASVALAGPPFLTDDPEPVAYRHWEAYVFSTYDHPHGGADVQGPAVEFNVGAAPELQLHLVVPWAWHLPDGGPATSGLGDVEVGFKLRFLDETDSRPQIGVFPMAELPTGNAARGLGNGKAWFRLPLWVQKSWGPWTTYGGVGWNVNHAPGQRDNAFAGWLVQRDLGKRLTLGGEVFAHGAEEVGGRGSTFINLGGYFNFTPGFSLLFSGGGAIAGEPYTIAYLGLYWTWGPSGR
jgi:hypothetical protein